MFLVNPYAYVDEATTYIDAVEAADGQALESGVKTAITDFITGCKTDGIWNAIKASCIMAGARTLSGALVPLVGAAPTNFNFVAGDYNRKTGIAGNGSTKYLNSNRNSIDDPKDNQHLSVRINTQTSGSSNMVFIAAGDFQINGSSALQTGLSNTNMSTRSRNVTGENLGSRVTGFFGLSRSNSINYTVRYSSSNQVIARTSQEPVNDNYFIFRGNASTPGYANCRLSYYSIGEALDLALLDARVTTLINAISAAIP